jgi:hypothetical protein
MKIQILILTLIISIQSSFAQNAVKITKGSKSPFSGVVLKESTFNGLVKSDKKVLKLEDLSIVQDELIDYHKYEASAYRKELIKEKIGNNLTSIGYFVLGVLVTSFAFKVQQGVDRL